MRIKCGKTKEEIKAKVDRLNKWHRWFAWYPMSVERGRCVWLETIERKCDLSGHNGYNFGNEYRFPEVKEGNKDEHTE